MGIPLENMKYFIVLSFIAVALCSGRSHGHRKSHNASMLTSSHKSSLVSDCSGFDGQGVFGPWRHEDFSNDYCEASRFDGTCIGDSECSAQNGQMSNKAGLCRTGDVCCFPEATCEGIPAYGSKLANSRKGSCIKSDWCTQASHVPANGECSPGLACCIPPEPINPITCPTAYSAVEGIIQKVQNRWGEALSESRLINFLPYGLKPYEYFSGPDYSGESSECASASYIAFYYFMLVDFTEYNPKDLVNNFSPNVPLQVYELLSLNSGYITPETFGKMVDIMWNPAISPKLNLEQYNSGTCSDWNLMFSAVFGDNLSPWPCDRKWKDFMRSHNCQEEPHN